MSAAQNNPPLDYEPTPIGEQSLVAGVRPVTLGDRLACRAAAPMTPKRNPNAEQKPCDLGLFDTAARDQLDLIDAIRAVQETSARGASIPVQPKE